MGLGLSHPAPPSDAAAAVLCSQDLLCTITSYQRGLPESLAPLVPGLRRMAHRPKQRISMPDHELDARFRTWLAAHDVEKLAPLLRNAKLPTGLPLSTATSTSSPSKGHTSVLDWLEARSSAYPRGLMECGVSSNQLDRGFLEILIYLDAHLLSDWHPMAVSIAAERGHVDVLRFLRAKAYAGTRPVLVDGGSEWGNGNVST
ncbi:hypothetical protein SPRG_11853 [Saprolegnia parasitica CBS 223.65]|uniref:Uncharacterized protein n=1 Tax=Saprolegnia parasitica (strain CBS 223.65) TaxID=695850 RepID=A0A067C858_SAPPC|nr:hypothetical protein SPRG_11853 [Saprolegnia parasitica CBS 223.65]KDO23007.1 hypothetical protein SPRG_11853 [Saprolegnia parasitica CBS 223.65]|eukprot:XP_012206295.1 hypothetical protein SPRG_11853 [Saprolegnia parasitica CBS 223.65]